MPSRPSLRPAAGLVPFSGAPVAAALEIDSSAAITIAPLPELPEPPAGSGWTAILPALGAVGMSAYAVLSGRLLVIVLALAGSAAAVAVSVVTRRSAVRRWRETCEGRRDRYLAHLSACRERALSAAHRQRSAAQQRYPPPQVPHALPPYVLDAPGPDGSKQVRLGVGRVPLQPPLLPPTPPHPSALPWPELAEALADLVTEVATVDDCPVTIDLASAGPLGLVGPVEDSRALAWAIRAQVPSVRVLDSEAGDPALDVPTVVLAATIEHLPAGVRTVGTWNPDGSLTFRPAHAPNGLGRQIVARPDQLTEAETHRLAALLQPVPAQAPRDQSLSPLAVVLGRTESGTPVTLDLAESAHGGDGPHGWVVGATGTGKSQLLRRLVVGLAAERSPDEVAFVLVDFKGGAAFDDLAGLPHVAGVLTNLDDRREQGDVERLIDALHAEVRRRQQVLRAAAVPDLPAYRLDPVREPVPHLVVVVDEAAELLGNCPEVLDTFATIGRVGRSLGIHLVLAAQRPEEARMRSLEGALRFRICLRTLTTADSVAVVRDPGAAMLPSAPGWGLLAVDGAPVRFRVTPVDGIPVITDSAPARRVWHPPLPAVAPTMLAAIATDPAAPAVLLGLGDAPPAQWQGPVALSLSGSAGHLAVVGAPRTGRTTALRTVAVNLAAAMPPTRLHLYVVGAGLDLAGLPHVGAVAHPADGDLVLDVISTVAALMTSRQRNSADGVRQLHRPADVVLVIDDWPQVRAALPDLEPMVADIAVAGLAVGIHLVLSAHRWSDLRPALRDCLGSRIELHLPDPLESLLPRGIARPPAGRPGRGVLLAGQPATMLPDVPLTDLPPLDVPLPLSLQVAHLAPDAEAQVSHRWSAHPAPVPRIDPLPPVALRPAGPSRTLGVGSAGPVAVDFDVTDRHLLVVGDAGSGRSTVLAGVGHLLTDADAWLVDPRRSLEDARIRALRAAHTPAEIETLLADLHRELLSTLDAGRRARRTLLLIDDQDVAAALTSPTAWSAIAALLPLAADLRLTVAVARRCAGMARLAYDPFLAAIREAGATGVLLDGSPDEGPIVAGVRCRPGPVGRALLVRPGQPPRPLQLYADLAEPERHVSNL